MRRRRSFFSQDVEVRGSFWISMGIGLCLGVVGLVRLVNGEDAVWMLIAGPVFLLVGVVGLRVRNWTVSMDQDPAATVAAAARRASQEVFRDLTTAIYEHASRAELEVRVAESTGDGFGLSDAPILQVAMSGRLDPVELFHDGNREFWVSFGNDLPDAAWAGRDLDTLAKAVIAGLLGHVELSGRRVVARCPDGDTIEFEDRL